MFKSPKWILIVVLALLVLGLWSAVWAGVINVEPALTETTGTTEIASPAPSYQPALTEKLVAMVNILRQILALEQQKLALIKAASEINEHEDSPPETALLLPPTITSVSPNHGPSGTVIVLRGRNFTPKDNTIFTGFGKLEAVSRDGESLSFTLQSPWNLGHTSWVKEPDFPEIKLRFYVRNSQGQTAVPGEFVLDL